MHQALRSFASARVALALVARLAAPLLAAALAAALGSCSAAPAPRAAWESFLVRGVVVAKAYQPAHAEPVSVAGQLAVRAVPARWVFVVSTHFGALTFNATPLAYYTFAEHDPVLVRGAVTADGRLRIDALARPPVDKPRPGQRSAA